MAVEQGFVVGVRRQHQAGDLGPAGPDLAADLDPVAIWQTHVEDGHIGLGRRNTGQRLLHRARFADDCDVAAGLEQRPQAAADDFVIVKEEYTKGHASIFAS